MIIRINPDNTVVIVKAVSSDLEDEFIKVNGTKIFKKIDTLPPSKYNSYVWNPETEQVVVNVDREKTSTKRDISKATDSYIQQKLSSIDEDLADITSEAQVIEGRILYIAAKEKVTITTDEVKQKIALFIAGLYTQEQAIEDLKAKGLSDESVQKILPLLARAVEIAKILNWKEEIWDKEGELEAQIDSMTLEELLQLDVRKMCEEAYAGIPLEV
jgi:hypothetical protein